MQKERMVIGRLDTREEASHKCWLDLGRFAVSVKDEGLPNTRELYVKMQPKEATRSVLKLIEHTR